MNLLATGRRQREMGGRDPAVRRRPSRAGESSVTSYGNLEKMDANARVARTARQGEERPATVGAGRSVAVAFSNVVVTLRVMKSTTAERDEYNSWYRNHVGLRFIAGPRCRWQVRRSEMVNDSAAVAVESPPQVEPEGKKEPAAAKPRSSRPTRSCC